MRYAYVLWFCFLLFLGFPRNIFHKPSIQVNADLGLIQKTCRFTNNYDLCVSILESNSSSFNTDTKGLAIVIASAGIANATATSTYLSSRLLNSNGEAIPKKVIRECVDKYKYAGGALEASTQDLAMESYDYASMHVMAAAEYPSACHNAFRRYSGLAYPVEIQRREDGLKQICDVVLGIIDLLFSES
ncbi:hypothetical protein K2173_012045 [Erythroxylum novogranatense]|uniref:Pectinesterase inhibitor domain-containing protein n=1 Tax=Erythroxylum novogranatense TaxID=1862640 RepID=A0AAV8TH94_9ROSI|nr:hypothetical protein K2173_012045 [Erythroxylum novogranatense]